MRESVDHNSSPRRRHQGQFESELNFTCREFFDHLLVVENNSNSQQCSKKKVKNSSLLFTFSHSKVEQGRSRCFADDGKEL